METKRCVKDSLLSGNEDFVRDGAGFMKKGQRQRRILMGLLMVWQEKQ